MDGAKAYFYEKNYLYLSKEIIFYEFLYVGRLDGKYYV